MIKQPINVDFDLNAKVSNSKVIAISHVDDKYNEVLEVNVRQNGAHIDLTGANVIARMVLHAEKDYLLNDNVPCTVSDSGNIMIPFDNAVVKTLQGIVKIEVSITRGEDKLTLQFPLWVSVRGSIIESAEVTPESEGTIPDLLREATEALEDAKEALEHFGSYSDLTDKPQINDVTLDGDQSADDLGLQKKLTAGANILIDANGNISVTGVTKYKEELNYTQLDNCTENGVLYYTTIGGYDAFVVARNGFDHIRQFAIVGDKRLITRRKQKETAYQPAVEWSAWEEIGVTDYEDLDNKPQINGVPLSGNMTLEDLGAQNQIYLERPPIFPTAEHKTGDFFLWNNLFYLQTGTNWLQVTGTYVTYQVVGRKIIYGSSEPPTSDEHVYASDYNTGDLYVKRQGQAPNALGDMTNANVYICTKVLFWAVASGKMHYSYIWSKIPIDATTLAGYGITDAYTKTETDAAIANKTITSALINQNGTIAFNDGDGAALFTTSGANLITSGNQQISMGYDSGGFYFLFDDGQEVVNNGTN